MKLFEYYHVDKNDLNKWYGGWSLCGTRAAIHRGLVLMSVVVCGPGAPNMPIRVGPLKAVILNWESRWISQGPSSSTPTFLWLFIVLNGVLHHQYDMVIDLYMRASYVDFSIVDSWWCIQLPMSLYKLKWCAHIKCSKGKSTHYDHEGWLDHWQWNHRVLLKILLQTFHHI